MLRIRGAREHNLKNINVDIPKNKLVVITGPSGSGKSSLAFDTIYAEGQRRYVESLSTYARQFLNIAGKPDVDSIEGLSPAISIEQKTVQNNPRSIVATITEIYDYMRLLFARIGIPYSPVTGKPIQAMSVQNMLDFVMQKNPKTKFTVLAPIIRGKKGEHHVLIQDLQKKGFSRIKLNKKYYDIEDVPSFNKNQKHTISVVVDRLVMVDVNNISYDDLQAFRLRLAQSIEQALELTAGIVMIDEIDKDMADTYSSKFSCPESGFSFTEIEPRIFSFNAHAGACETCQGLGQVHKGVTIITCPTCEGYRLKKESLHVKIKMLHIGQVCEMSIIDAFDWFEKIELTRQQNDIAEPVLKEIRNRLGFLVNVGLGYLNLNRVSGTLSGGEGQRIRLASQIGSQLTGVLYVLDEPSIGLHQRDNEKLINTLKKMRDLGNTIIVVEHDEDTMLASDYILDVGPKSGIYGGEIVAEGTPQQIMDNKNSITGQYLSKQKMIPIPKTRRLGNGKKLSVKNATLHNLKNLTVHFPLGKFICVTGVSGGGKSSLVMGTLCHDYMMANHKNLEGVQYVDKLIEIDQRPIGKTPRSNPATYIGLFDEVRDWFTALPESKARGYKPGRFSFNVPGGRCDACDGDGTIRVSMHFLADAYTTCEECEGKRFNKQTLEIFYKGKNIADILNMSVDEAAEFFKMHHKILKKLELLQKVGLGYLKVGHSATLLSGGEAQRIKLAKELSRSSTSDTVYVLDEPTTGLHFDDIKKLLEILQTFVNKGSTVIVIEHNLEVIKTADWIIDLGPEGGAQGGEVIAEGTPEQVSVNEKSVTGAFLRRMLTIV